MAVARHVLLYLKGNPRQGLLMRSDSNQQIRAYYDSDLGACPITRRSLSGYFVTHVGSPVSYKTKKQTTVSRSSAKAEYRAMAAKLMNLSSFGLFLHHCENLSSSQ